MDPCEHQADAVVVFASGSSKRKAGGAAEMVATGHDIGGDYDGPILSH
jgi:hypothetical protein